jgi:hypothetical protein
MNTMPLLQWRAVSYCIILQYSFFIIIFGAGVEPSPLLLRPFIRLLYQSYMIDGDYCRQLLAEETGVLGGNVSQWRYRHHRYHVTWPGLEPGPTRWETGY